MQCIVTCVSLPSSPVVHSASMAEQSTSSRVISSYFLLVFMFTSVPMSYPVVTCLCFPGEHDEVAWASPQV